MPTHLPRYGNFAAPRRRLLAILFAALPGATLLATTSAHSAEPAARAAEPAARAADPAARAVDKRAIESQAERLGDPSYAMRERATRQLIDAGIAARPAMLRLLANSDPEVRARAEKILRVITEYDFRSRLDKFAADVDGKRNYDLPGWERFRRELGDGREARALFVAMQRAEPALWEAFASLEPGLGALYAESCEEAQSMIQESDGEGTELAVGAIATILFLSGASEVTVDEENASMIETLIHYPAFEQGVRNQQTTAVENMDRVPGFSAGMRTAVTRTLYRRLLSMWIARDTAPSLAMTKLRLALHHGLKEAGLALARQELAGDGGTLEARTYAILALGRFGSREDLPLVETCFKDDKVCIKYKFNRRNVQVQVREVALAVAARLTDQDVKAFGFDRTQPHPELLYVAGSLGLADDAARSKAFQKWAEWKAAQADGQQNAGGEKQAGK